MTPMSEDGWGDVVDESTCVHSFDDQESLEYLFDQGFTFEQAMRLVIMRRYEHDLNTSDGLVHFHMQNMAHMEFAQWLYWNGILQS